MVNMGTVWDRTTEFLSDNIGAILPIALLAIFVPQSISSAISPAHEAVGQAASQGIALLLLLPILWGQLAIAALTVNPDAGRGAAMSVATRRFGQMLAAMLIVFAGVLLLCAPILIALAASGVDLTAMIGSASPKPNIPTGIATFVLLYGIALAVVLIFASVRLTTLLFAVVAAEGGVIAALRRSFALTRGIFWKTFGVLLLFGIVLWAACLAVTFVFGSIFQLLAPGAGPFSVGAIVVAILIGVLTTAYSVIVSIFSAKLYRASVTARQQA